MLESLALGVPASQLFRNLQKQDASIDARELANILTSEFPDISPAAYISIIRWARPAEGLDFPDEQLDGLISHYLNAAGYIR